MSKDVTTIKLERSTRNKLASLGTKDSSFDDIVKNLLEKTEVLQH